MRNAPSYSAALLAALVFSPAPDAAADAEAHADLVWNQYVQFVEGLSHWVSDDEKSADDINSDTTTPEDTDASEEEKTDTASGSDEDDRHSSLNTEEVRYQRKEALQNATRDFFTRGKVSLLAAAALTVASQEQFFQILCATHPFSAARQIINLKNADQNEPALDLFSNFFAQAVQAKLPALEQLPSHLSTSENARRLSEHPFHFAIYQCLRRARFRGIDQNFLDELFTADWKSFQQAADFLATYHLFRIGRGLATAQNWENFFIDFNFIKNKRGIKDSEGVRQEVWSTLALRYPETGAVPFLSPVCYLMSYFAPPPPLQRYVRESRVYENYCGQLICSSLDCGLFSNKPRTKFLRRPECASSSPSAR